jgi:hypothetical protein
MIGLLKPCLEQAIAGKRYSYGELATVMAEAAQVVNSRPIARGSEDTQAGGPITPLHLQLGRATVEVPRVRFEEAPSLTRRLQHAEEGVKQFWKKWMHLVFQEKLLSRTWRKVKRNVTVGDVVYMMEKDDDDEFCRMGVVEEVKAGPDGCIRTATVRYTNPGSDPHHRSAPKLAVRPIHKLAVIVPVDYRFEEDLTQEAEPRGCREQKAIKRDPEDREYDPGSGESGQDSRPSRDRTEGDGCSEEGCRCDQRQRPEKRSAVPESRHQKLVKIKQREEHGTARLLLQCSGGVCRKGYILLPFNE